MTESEHFPPELDWLWEDSQRVALLRCFRHELVRYVEALNAWTPNSDEKTVTRLKEVAARFAAAAADLDIAATNCHALAATLTAHANGDGFTNASADGAVRLRHALGKMVMLTHTTIEALMGKRVRLEYLDGANAIVEINGEYWGTPLDRIFVVPGEDDPPESVLPAATSSDMPSGVAFQFLLRSGELSNAIQFLTMTSRQGELVVQPSGPEGEGKLFFAKGRLCAATFGEYEGIDALARMMNVERAFAVFRDLAVIGKHSPELQRLSTEQLLIEAAVRADELNI